jgi:hypothetical protein
VTDPLWSIAFECLNLCVCKNLEEAAMFEAHSISIKVVKIFYTLFISSN